MFGPYGNKIFSIRNKQLLISGHALKELLIYSSEGKRLSSKNISSFNTLLDATWTPLGDIMCIVRDPVNLVKISESKLIIIQSEFVHLPGTFSLFSDGTLYLTDAITGVYKSIDDGLKWTFVFKLVDGWYSRKVIKTTAGNAENFWSLDWTCSNTSCNTIVRMYNVYTSPFYKLTWEDVNLITPDGTYIVLNNFDLGLCYDGVSSIFLSESSSGFIHIFSVAGQYRRRLLPTDHIIKHLHTMVTDTEHCILFIAQNYSMVTAFKLIYEEKVCAHN